MKVRFWGTRGSIPTPLKPQEVEEKIVQAILRMPDIDTGNEQAVRSYLQTLPPLVRGTTGGNTPCVEIPLSDHEVIVMDAGSGLRELGMTLMRGPWGRGQGILHILISHPHWDHLHGFIMFTPAFVPGNRILFYGVHDLEKAFHYQQQFSHWPVTLEFMQATKNFIRLEAGQPFNINGIAINTFKNTHPGGSYSYRFEDEYSKLVYSTDVEFKQLTPRILQPYIDFCKDADAVIFDAQYTLREAWQKVDWGHSSAMIGIDLMRAANVDKLILFHHDPTYTDQDLIKILDTARAYQAQEAELPPHEVLLAYEGLTLNLVRPGSVNIKMTPDGEAQILTPIYSIGRESVGRIAEQFSRPGDQHTHSAIIDLSQIEVLTTADLKDLVNLHLKATGRPIILAAPSEQVYKVIELAGYGDYFAIYPSVETALAAVQSREELNLPGQVVKQRYQIETTLGGGALGTVVTALDMATGEHVALKILSPTFSPETTRRFIRQAQQLLTLNHPNIVKVYAWGEESEYTFEVEELIQAPTLQEFLDERSVSVSDDMRMGIIKDILSALDYAHQQGIIHGDLKPSNIYLTPNGNKLSGFGLGRLEENHTLITAPFLFLNAHYLAPEQILGQPLDTRTDLYALGVILYQLFTSELPFAGSEAQLLQAHLRQSPRPPSEINPDISPAQEHFILKLLAKNPNERYASAQQVLHIVNSFRLYPPESQSQYDIPLIGRDQAWKTLRDCWEEARRGHGQLAFITGESGIGKTALAQKVAAQSQPPVLLRGQCQEPQSTPAYHLFTEIMRMYCATVPPEFRDDENRQLIANFAQLVPGIHAMLPDLPTPPSLEAKQEQLRLMTSLAQFIKRATQRRPWLIILEDLQWADRSSLELLRYIGHHTPTMQLLIIGTYREEEVTQGHPLLDTLHALSSYPGYVQIFLERLDIAGVEQLLGLIWRTSIPQPLVQKIYEHTEGNPRYVEEIAQGLLDNGIITAQEPVEIELVSEQLQIPRSVHEAVKQRIERLSPGAHKLLYQAAILGPTFSFDDLQEMSNLSKWETLEHLDMALERQLLQEIPGDTILRFRHNEIQHVLYSELGPLRRQMLHRKAGEALERRAGADVARIADKLAYHFGEAGDYHKSLEYSLQAARQAQKGYDNEAAVVWFQRILDTLHPFDQTADPQLQSHFITAHQSLGEVRCLMGQYQEALNHALLAWKQLEQRNSAEAASPEGPRPTTQKRLGRLCYLIADIHKRRSEYNLALEWVERGLAHLKNQKLSVEVTDLYNLSGWINMHQGNYAEAQSHLQQALIFAQAAHLVEAEATSLRYLGLAAEYQGQDSVAQANYKQALQLYRDIAKRDGEGAALNQLGGILRGQGHYAEARASYEQALQIYREIGARQGEGALLNNLSMVAQHEREYDQAIRFCEQALEIYRDIGDKQGEGDSLLNLGIITRDHGEYDMAKAYFKQAVLIMHALQDPRGSAKALYHLGVVAITVGLYAQAQIYHQQALKIRQETGDRAGESESLAYLGMLAYLAGDYKTAQRYTQQAETFAQEVNHQSGQAQAWLFSGHALMGAAYPRQAADAYQRAEALYKDLNQPHHAVEAQAGILRVAYLQKDWDQVEEKITGILKYLEDPTAIYGMENPLRVYLICYEALRDAPAKNNGAPSPVDEILNKAHNMLSARAAKIGDEQTRKCYLEQIAVHREIIAEHEKRHQSTTENVAALKE